MNIKYFYEFKGLDGDLYRVEILTDEEVSAVEVKAANEEPLVLEYENKGKLYPCAGSQANMTLISQSNFQFVNLFTDEQQEYLVKLYKNGVPYWYGWLDSELYDEVLSSSAPYEVSFSAADFSVLERLMYVADDESKFTDTVSCFTHIQRCLHRLNLPFNYIYIGCTTDNSAEPTAANQTILHTEYIQSVNFYDEDGDPMSCRDVIEAILKPFGLTMVQKYGGLLIVDYNTIKGKLPVKWFNAETGEYALTAPYNFDFGDLYEDKGFASTDSSFSFEEMYNNVTIKSSMYSSGGKIVDAPIEKELLSIPMEGGGNSDYTYRKYAKCKGWTESNGANFIRFEDLNSNDDLIGAQVPYVADSTDTIFRFETSDIVAGSKDTYINVSMEAYINARTNPFIEDEDEPKYAELQEMVIFGNIFLIDNNGTVTHYLENYEFFFPFEYEVGYINYTARWIKVIDGIVPQLRSLFQWQAGNPKENIIQNKWAKNNNIISPAFKNARTDYLLKGTYDSEFLSKGFIFRMASLTMEEVSGRIVIELSKKVVIRSVYRFNLTSYATNEIAKNVLLRNFKIIACDSKGQKMEFGDIEFKSYINKKVKSDLDEVELKVVNANEEQFPISRASLMRKVGNIFVYSGEFVRAGATNILERLLMRTLHSNYTSKNRAISVVVKGTDNPMLYDTTYNGVGLTNKMLILGCKIDLKADATEVECVEYDSDTIHIGNIPYD